MNIESGFLIEYLPNEHVVHCMAVVLYLKIIRTRINIQVNYVSTVYIIHRSAGSVTLGPADFSDYLFLLIQSTPKRSMYSLFMLYLLVIIKE